jgi:hypothetical protein
MTKTWKVAVGDYVVEVADYPRNYMSYDEAAMHCLFLKINKAAGWRIPTAAEYNKIDGITCIIDRYRDSGLSAPFDQRDFESAIRRPLLPVRTIKDPAVHT